MTSTTLLFSPCLPLMVDTSPAPTIVESATVLVDEVIPEKTVGQWVLSVPNLLRFLLAKRPAVMGGVLGVV